MFQDFVKDRNGIPKKEIEVLLKNICKFALNQHKSVEDLHAEGGTETKSMDIQLNDFFQQHKDENQNDQKRSLEIIVNPGLTLDLHIKEVSDL